MNYNPCSSLRIVRLQVLLSLQKLVETIFFKHVAPIMVCMGINVTYHVLHTVMIASAT